MRNPIDSQEPPITSQIFNYVNVDLIEEELICPICQLPFVDPVVHRCENTFCSKCIETLTTCPFCREEGDLKKNCSAAHKIIRNQLDKLKVHCNMCKNVVNRGELKDHQEKYCPLLEAYVEVEKKKHKLDLLYQSNVEEWKKQNQVFIAGEKEKMEQERSRMLKEVEEKEQKTLAFIRSQNEALEKERQLFQQEKASRYKLEFSNKPVHLNVGGSFMTVALSYFIGNRIEPNTLFKKMFNGEHPLYYTPTSTFDKVFFIDCHPEVFQLVLDWLQTGRLFECDLDEKFKFKVAQACLSFKLENLGKRLREKWFQNGLPISQFQFFEMVDPMGKKLHFNGLEFIEITFDGINLVECQFTDCHLSKLWDNKWEKCIFTQCHFSDSISTNIFVECEFNNCTFTKFKTVTNYCSFNDCEMIEMDMSAMLNEITECQPELSGKTAKLLYKAFTAQAFHSLCDGYSSTITFIKSEHDYIFGGYTQAKWAGDNEDFSFDNNAFIFTFKDGNELEVFKVKNASCAIYNDPTFLASFGEGYDIYISDECNNNNDSYSDFGYSYNLPHSMQTGEERTMSYLAGSYRFQVTEIETYQLFGQ